MSEPRNSQENTPTKLEIPDPLERSADDYTFAYVDQKAADVMIKVQQQYEELGANISKIYKKRIKRWSKRNGLIVGFLLKDGNIQTISLLSNHGSGKIVDLIMTMAPISLMPLMEMTVHALKEEAKVQKIAVKIPEEFTKKTPAALENLEKEKAMELLKQVQAKPSNESTILQASAEKTE